MERALALAAQAKAAGKAALSPALQLWSFALPYLLLAAGEVPVGAVLVHEGAVVAEACNQTEAHGDPTAHAEMLCIRQVHEHGHETASDQSWVAESLEGVVEWAKEMQLLWKLACVSRGHHMMSISQEQCYRSNSAEAVADGSAGSGVWWQTLPSEGDLLTAQANAGSWIYAAGSHPPSQER